MTLAPRPLIAALVAAACVLGAAGCSSDPGSDGGSSSSSATSSAAAPANGKVTVDDATIDWPANPSVAAVRMIVRNGTAKADALVGVSSPAAGSAMIHRTETDAEGRSTMSMQDRIDIPARSSVTFAPGGLHVMLTGITEDLQVGDDVEVTLEFQHAGTVTTTATVVEPASSAEPEHAHVP